MAERLPTVRVQIVVNTFSLEYGPLHAGQQIDAQPTDADIWIKNGIAVAIAGVTPTAPALAVAAGYADLALATLTANVEVELAQSNHRIQGLNVVVQNGRLAARKPGFFTITFYLMADKLVAGLANIQVNGSDYRSMPLVASNGSKGHAEAATATCIAVGNLPEDAEVGATFKSTDGSSATVLEAGLSMMGG